MITPKTTAILCACLGSWFLAPAGGADSNEGIPFPSAGKIRPRHAREISGSNWSVGAEKLDRDFTVYENWKAYLGPLGVKKARIQGGWAKTEQRQGTYDFAWLDRIVFDMASQGVEPWMCLCYGNPIYEGGGDPQVGGRVPTSESALAAWANWVKATVSRYQGQVDEWEIWNEPNYHVAAQDYARLLILTAEAVRSVQPKAIIVALALGSHVDYKYADTVLGIVKQQGKLSLIDQISHHRHQRNPDVRGPEINLEQVVARYSDRIVLRQGEAGCPSEQHERAAMAHYPWTELTQSKHVLRRLLGDLGRDKESSVFYLMDPNAAGGKGLVRAHDDRTVDHPKPAYYAVQNLTAVFDNHLVRIRNFQPDATGELPLSVYAYRHEPSGRPIITLWLNGDIPTNDNRKTAVDLTFPNPNFGQPLYVDLRTGRTYEIPRDLWSTKGASVTFKQMPVYDSPVLIADRAALPLVTPSAISSQGPTTTR